MALCCILTLLLCGGVVWKNPNPIGPAKWPLADGGTASAARTVVRGGTIFDSREEMPDSDGRVSDFSQVEWHR